MVGPVQSTDIDVQLSTELDQDLGIPDNLHVIKCNVDRMFAGGGSTAKVEVVFDELLSNNQKSTFQRLVEADSLGDLPDNVRQDVRRTRQDKQGYYIVETSGIDLDNVPDRIDDASNIVVIDPDEISLEDMTTDKMIQAYDDSLTDFQDTVEEAVAEDRGSLSKTERFWGAIITATNYDDSGILQNFSNLAGISDVATPNIKGLDGIQTLEDLRNTTTRKKVLAARSAAKPLDGSLAKPILDPITPDFDVPFDNVVGPGELDTETTELANASLVQPENRQLLDITMEIQVDVEFPIIKDSGDAADAGIQSTIFTGTVDTITESHDRVVTFEAIDKRLQLNRNSIFLEVGERTSVLELINRSMKQMSFERLEDFQIERSAVDKVANTYIEEDAWGVRSHTTVYEYLQDLVSRADITMYIDAQNVLRFADYPRDITLWDHGSRDASYVQTLPPIVEWTSADEEELTETITETSYDSTGLGIYSSVSKDRLDETIAGSDADVDIRAVNTKVHDNSIITTEAVKQETGFRNDSKVALRSSGKITIVGWPTIDPYDNVHISDKLVNGFKPISEGTHMIKEVKHIFSSQRGYVVELKLTSSPDKVADAFADAASGFDDAGSGGTGDNALDDIGGGGGGANPFKGIPVIGAIGDKVSEFAN